MTIVERSQRTPLVAHHEISLEDGAGTRILAGLATPPSRLPWGRLDQRPGRVRHGRVQPPGMPLCEVTIRALDVDEDAGRAHFDFHARESAGPGVVSGALEARIHGSNLVLDAAFRGTGIRASAQAVERVADALLRDVGEAIEALAASPAGRPAHDHRATARDEGRRLPSVSPAAAAGLAAVAATGLALRTFRRRRTSAVSLTYRW